MTLDGGRAQVSLSSTSAAVVLFVLGMLACGVYLVGFHRGRTLGRAEGFQTVRRMGEDEIAQARRAAVDPRLTEGLTVPQRPPVPATGSGVPGEATGPADPVWPGPPSPGPASTSTIPAGAVSWVRGNNYVVVQSFKPGALDDAVTVQDYLARHDIGTQIVSKADGGFWVITTQGFNLDDAAQKPLADALQQRIRSVGAVFRSAGGRYDFQTCFLMKLKSDTW
ncbi:MAG: hypothetical protein C4547_02365 [Phycisphaerales bacterium]|nr:MAG: hypothetical protein C4547_02365 [Phycisphaerales bacterium]